MSNDTPKPVFLLLSGPAGSGKTTLCERLVAAEPGVKRLVTATTRPMRPGEVDGVDYFFMTPERFDISVAEGEFLEWAWVHGKNRYGTLRRSVLESLAAGVCLVGAIDVQGVRSVRAAAGTDPVLRAALTTVFVAPESIEELMTRLSGRGDAPADIERRMQTAVAEFREAAAYDHRIVSTTRDADFAELHAIWKLAVCRR